MTYRDMTFCSYYITCVDGDECPRALTPRIIEAADGEPISQFAEKPECYEEDNPTRCSSQSQS